MWMWEKNRLVMKKKQYVCGEKKQLFFYSKKKSCIST